jgi:hypothetical protein
MRFEVFTATNMAIFFFWLLTPYELQVDTNVSEEFTKYQP